MVASTMETIARALCRASFQVGGLACSLVLVCMYSLVRVSRRRDIFEEYTRWRNRSTPAGYTEDMYLSVHPDIIHRINCCSVEPTSALEYPLSLTTWYHLSPCPRPRVDREANTAHNCRQGMGWAQGQHGAVEGRHGVSSTRTSNGYILDIYLIVVHNL